MPITNPSQLIEVTDAHFLWMLGKGAAPSPEFALPQGGVDAPEILSIVRGMTKRLHATGSRGSWMIVAGNEVVGLCSYKQAPKDGSVEIGYGVAPSCRNRGHATRAVAAMLGHARADPMLTTVTAGTATANIASQRALERNGFERTGLGSDPDDGELILWTRFLR